MLLLGVSVFLTSLYTSYVLQMRPPLSIWRLNIYLLTYNKRPI